MTGAVRADDGTIRGQAWARVDVAAVAGLGTALGTGFVFDWNYAASAGWVVAATVFLVWTWAVVHAMDAAATAVHATSEDPSRRATQGIVLVASVASLAAVGYLLVKASTASGITQDLIALLAVTNVTVSWLVVHTLFALRYAILFYEEGGGGDGAGWRIDFNDSEPPSYADFAYLAFTIGMTFQVSDTQLRSRKIRATVLRHALLSYLFGSLILAAAVNLIASLASSK